jgi:hypothetical protein
MIIVADIIKTAPGGIGKAVDFATKVFDYIEKTGLITGRFSIFRPHTGDRNARVVFAAWYDSLAEYETSLNKCVADSGYIAFIEELRAADWFLGSEKRISDVIKASD